MDYQQLKEFLSGHRDHLVLGACFILVFLIGFGSGRFDRTVARAKQPVQSHYTTSAKQNPAPTPSAAPTSASSTASSLCPVKGNISSSGKKIYHVPGGAFYNTVKPEQCFNTEAQAQAAGFVKSKR